ncbi:MAG: peptide deformylase [Bacilli bacterium]|nr:peptide deformylase [Bacilli bacterium]
MAIYQILIAPNPLLNQTAKPVKEITPSIVKLLTNMAETMYDASGIGLAAPQVGILKRVIVVDVESELIEMVNPEITFAEGEELAADGCLSIPGIGGETMRAKRVIVQGWNRHGETIEVDATGRLSHCFQHEIDHLNGILFTQKAVRTFPLQSDSIRKA